MPVWHPTLSRPLPVPEQPRFWSTLPAWLFAGASDLLSAWYRLWVATGVWNGNIAPAMGWRTVTLTQMVLPWMLIHIMGPMYPPPPATAGLTEPESMVRRSVVNALSATLVLAMAWVAR